MVVKLKQRRDLISNDVFNVYLDHIEDDGIETPDYLVIQPRTLSQQGLAGVAVLPVCSGRIGLIHVHRHPINITIWEVPRGFIDKAETIVQAAQRELLEESGLYCDVSDLEMLGVMAPEPGVINAKVATLVAKHCRCQEQTIFDEPGHLDFRLFSPEEVERLIEQGEIIDPFTLTLFLRLRAGL